MRTVYRARAFRASTSGALLAALLALTAGCVTVQAGDGGVVWGGSIIVGEGEVADQELVAFGGSVRIDGETRHEVVVIGGSLEVNGTVGSDAVVVGGALRLGPNSRIRGDAVVVGGGMDRAAGAEIDGEVVSVGWGGMPWAGTWSPFAFWGPWGTSVHVAIRTTQLMYWLLLAVLVVALVGDRVSSASHAIAREPLRLGLIGVVGFFALLLATVLFFILSLVLIGLPFLLATLLLWWVAYIFGMVAVFQLLGDRIGRLFGRTEMSQLGLVLIGGLALCILHYFPTVGTAFWWIGGFLGLGAVFATRFGSGRPWFRGGSASTTPPPPSAPPAGTPAAEPPADPGAADEGEHPGPGPSPGQWPDYGDDEEPSR